MGINSGKFYDAKLMRRHYDAIKNATRKYDDKADATRAAYNEFYNNEMFRGVTADGLKRLIRDGAGQMLNDVTALHAQMVADEEYMMESFAGIVDSSSSARIEYDTLEKINEDFKGYCRRFNDNAKAVRDLVDGLNSEFGNYAYFEQPNSKNAIENFNRICGGEAGTTGFFKECQNKLVEYDENMKRYLKNRDTMDRCIDVQKRVDETSMLISGSKYTNLPAQNIEANNIDGPEKTGQDLTGKLEEFMSNIAQGLDKSLLKCSLDGLGAAGDKNALDAVSSAVMLAAAMNMGALSANVSTITGLSESDKLVLCDPKTDKYEFEILLEKCRKGYNPSQEEIAVLTQLYDEYFGKIENKTASAEDIEIAERLLKGLVTVNKPQFADESYEYQLNENLAMKILNGLDPKSLAAITICRMNIQGECGVENALGADYSMDILSFDIKMNRAGIELTMNIDQDNDGIVDIKHDKGMIVSEDSAAKYLKDMQAKDPKFGNGVSKDQLVRTLTSVRTKADMNFIECLINDDDYDDAFNLHDDLSLSAQFGLVDYQMYYYQTDADGNLIAGPNSTLTNRVPTESTEEFIKILNSALKGDPRYIQYMYVASELKAASTSDLLACYDKDNADYAILEGQFTRELNVACMYGELSKKAEDLRDSLRFPQYINITNIEQVSAEKGLAISYNTMFTDLLGTGPVGPFELDNKTTYTFYTFNGDLGEVLAKNEMRRANQLDDVFDDQLKNAILALAKDTAYGVACFAGPEAMVLAATFNLGIDVSLSQAKDSLYWAYTNTLEAAKQNTSSQIALSRIDTGSKVGSTASNILFDIMNLNMSVAASNERMSQESIKYKAMWFGTGLYTYVYDPVTKNQKVDVIFKISFISITINPI